MQQDVYVSITGLQVRRVWHIPSFWSLAMKSMMQARNAPGNISADARTINGVHHTLSVWTEMDAMQAYLTAGPHLEAMRRFPSIATGKVVGYLANSGSRLVRGPCDLAGTGTRRMTARAFPRRSRTPAGSGFNCRSTDDGCLSGIPCRKALAKVSDFNICKHI